MRLLCHASGLPTNCTWLGDRRGSLSSAGWSRGPSSPEAPRSGRCWDGTWITYYARHKTLILQTGENKLRSERLEVLNILRWITEKVTWQENSEIGHREATLWKRKERLHGQLRRVEHKWTQNWPVEPRIYLEIPHQELPWLRVPAGVPSGEEGHCWQSL